MASDAYKESKSSDTLVRGETKPSYIGRAGLPAPHADDGMEMGALWGALRDHWRRILAIALLLTLAVMLQTMFSRMEFKSVGRLYLGELDAKYQGGDLDVLGSASGDVPSELEILKSRTIVLEAISKAALNATIQPLDWQPPVYWRWLLSGRNPALLQGASRKVAVAAASLPKQAREPDFFQVSFLAPREYEVRHAEQIIGRGTLDVPFASAVGSFTLLPGSAGTPRAGDKFTLKVGPLEDAADAAMKDLTLLVPKAGANELVKVVTLEFTCRSPTKAAEFLKQLMAGYLRERQSWKTADATAAEAFVSDQLRGMRETLDITQKKLADYRTNTKLVVLDNEAKALIEQMGKYEEQRVAARLQVSALADIQRVLRNPNPPVEAYLLGEAADTVLEGLGRSLAESRQELTRLQERFNDAAPDVRHQKAQIDAQLDTIRNYVSSRHARAHENLGALTGIIGQFEARLKSVPGAELGLAQLARESDVYSKLYSYLLERQQQAAILKASTVSKNRVLDVPEPARKESSPELAFRLASVLFGLLLGVVVVLIRRLFASTLQGDSDVRSIVGPQSVLANVPRFVPQAQHHSRSGEVMPGFASIASDATSPFVEAFRALRTSLYHASDARVGQVLLLTSPTPGDGKTTSTLALATMLAADAKWVLVVDADLRKPSHHSLSEHKESLGLRGILSGQVAWLDEVRPVHGPFGEFFSIHAGTPGPTELMSSERMSRFLIEARSRYDFVLIDSASFPLVADALALAPLADAVLSVVRLDHTPRELAAEHVERMAAVARRYGVVVNGASSMKRYGYGTAYPRTPKRSIFSLWMRRRGARDAG